MEEIVNSKDNFFVSLLKETAKWFFRGIGSCASLVLGYFFVVAAIFTTILALSGQTNVSSNLSSNNQEVFRDYGGDKKIALIELSGLILEKEDLSSPFYTPYASITPSSVENMLDLVRSDPNIKGVILHISSPGGSPVASDLIYEVISDFKKDTTLPVVVLMGDVAASGGYYISAPADYIFANPSTITGSIGVIMETYNLSGLYEKIGVRKETFKAGEYKDILSDSREITPEESVMINNLMQDAYQTFLTRVSEGRKLSMQDVVAVAEGKIYSGLKARDVGLVDSVGTLNDAIAYTASRANLTEYQVVKMKSGSFFDEIFGGISYSLRKTGAIVGISGVNEPKFRILYKLP